MMGEVYMESKEFKQLDLGSAMLNVVEKLYFTTPTPIQVEAIPAILAGKSIVGQSQTGSGKTHAYLLPLLNNIDSGNLNTQVVITAPTRELAMQIHEDAKEIIALLEQDVPMKSRLIIGGIDRERMVKQLKNNAQIIIGTPGRILDMVNAGALSIYSARSFVIDEADLMLDFRFIESIDELLVKCKKDVQISVFSATIPEQLQQFMKKYLRSPLHIKVENGLAPDKLEHRLIEKKHRDITKRIVEISKITQPYVALLFTNSKESANELGENLKKAGLNVGILHGGLTSRERKRMVKAIIDLQYQYIVATDLASRGIDIKGASHVINVDLPKEIDFYVHRVGRTARAGLEGTAISFFGPEDVELIAQLEKRGIKFIYSDIKDEEWVTVKHHNRRQLRKNTETKIDQQAWQQVRKPKKVKPGYKQKLKKQQERIKNQMIKQKNRKK